MPHISNKFSPRVKLIILPFLCLYFANVYGQSSSPYYTNSAYQKYISYLLNRKRLNLEHPLCQSFTVNEILDSLPNTTKSKWIDLLEKDLKSRISYQKKDTNSKGNFNAGFEFGNRAQRFENRNSNDLFANGIISYSYKNIILYNSISLDPEYKRDTAYFGLTGKLENKVTSRSNESYLKWENKNYTLFAGRVNRNFGLFGENSLILSPETYSMDQIAISFHNKWIKYTSLFSRLNDIYGFDIRDSIPKSSWNKRFLNIHRFDISISKNLEFAFTDVFIFGGKDAVPQFQYLNPVNFLFMSKMNDRKGYEEMNANALMCFDILYRPFTNFTFFYQFLIDDVDFTKSLRKVFPDRLGWSSALIYTDLIPASQIKLSFIHINNWTYNSFYTWGNYTFYGKSLGYPKNGVENLKLTFDSFKYFPFTYSLEILAERHRYQDLNAPFVAVKSSFPIGISQKFLSASLNAMYLPNSFFSASFTTEFITFDNLNFIENQKRSFVNFYLKLKMQGVFQLF